LERKEVKTMAIEFIGYPEEHGGNINKVGVDLSTDYGKGYYNAYKIAYRVGFKAGMVKGIDEGLRLAGENK
jgi:hypothetical protein